MSWLSANSFFVIILLLCVGLHLLHGHGRHDDHGGKGKSEQPRERDHHH